MNKLSSMVVIKKINNGIGYFYQAYFRGTDNRVRQANGDLVPSRTKISALKFDLLNNPMERGVIAYEFLRRTENQPEG